MNVLKQTSFFLLFLVLACSPHQTTSTFSEDITGEDIIEYIRFLASDELQGREAGTADEAKAANYIADLFRDFGLEPAGDDHTFFQEFTINTAVLNNPHATDTTQGEKRLAKNVVGLLQGTGNSDEFIVIGAHYDHLGYGSFGSLYRGEEPRIHNGADDNASGTAGLLELAHYFSKHRPETDILFLAFSGEEMGLLGSAYYVEHPTMDLDHALAMINMDMIGRFEEKLIIFGVGTAENWAEIITSANTDSLTIDLVKDGTGASDHTSFYYKNIPVLHYFTDTHSDYHRPSDDTEYINEEGEALVLEHLVRVVEQLDKLDQEQLAFKEAPGEQRQSMRLEGPTLGVLPDYGYDGEGMRITGTNEGGPAANAGLQAGDIIIGLGGEHLGDIYDYMEALNKHKKGQRTTVTVLREGKKITMDLQF